MLTYILFITGFFILIKGADILVDGSTSIAKKLKVPNIVIGLTIVAFGTSLPEFVVNIFASAEGNTDIAIGNILGSNIANILLILGISAIIYPLTTKKNTVWKEIPFSLLAAILVGILANDAFFDNSSYSALTRIDGIVFLSFMIIFFYYTLGIVKLSGETAIDNGKDENPSKEVNYFKSILLIITGLAGLTLGGKWIVEGGVKIAENLNMSQSFIGLTIIALGTSLPELATSAVAAFKKQTDIAVGNVVGSNILNIFWVLGFSSLIRPLPFSPESERDIIMLIIASLILFLTMFLGKKQTIERWHGVIMVIIYISYITFLIINN